MNPRKNSIICCARSWVGTQFKHQGRLKKSQEHDGGCDCIGLIIGVAKELSLDSKILKQNGFPVKVHELDYKSYGKVPKKSILSEKISAGLYEKKIEISEPGDLIVFSIKNRLEHVGIKSTQNVIIHTLSEINKVIEQEIPSHLIPKAAFSFYEDKEI